MFALVFFLAVAFPLAAQDNPLAPYGGSAATSVLDTVDDDHRILLPIITIHFDTALQPLNPSAMVFIPAGSFQSGCSPEDAACGETERPPETVHLDAYFIDTYEVTNARYFACETDGGCTPPRESRSRLRNSYYGDPAFARYPVVNVDWFQAAAFCAWEGKRLPTEAEWQKAARGNADARIYPWGSETPTCEHGNFFLPDPGMPGCVGDTSAIGSYALGVSPYGVMDMSGNVWEWMSGWYGSSSHGVQESMRSSEDAAGFVAVLRGGSYDFSASLARISFQTGYSPGTWVIDSGMRCVRDP